jgi:hypothetical protein
VYLLQAFPVRSVVAALTLKYSFFFCFAMSATASAADEVGTSKSASAPERSYISVALVLAMSGLFVWSAVMTSIFLVTAESPYFALKSSTASFTASTEFFPDSAE